MHSYHCLPNVTHLAGVSWNAFLAILAGEDLSECAHAAVRAEVEMPQYGRRTLEDPVRVLWRQGLALQKNERKQHHN